MLGAIHSVFDRMERANLTLGAAASLVAAAILLRSFIEAFANANNDGQLDGFLDIFFHYPFWFVGLLLAVMLVVAKETNIPLRTAWTVTAFSSLVVLTPPLIDLMVYGPFGQTYNFVVSSPLALIIHFVTFLAFTGAIGIGIKTEIALAVLASFLYGRYKTGSTLRGFRTALGVYAAIFAFLAFPTLGALAYGAATGQDVLQTAVTAHEFYFVQEPAESNYWPRPILAETREEGSFVGGSVANHFSVSNSILLLLACFVLVAFAYAKARPAAFRAVVRNARFTRIIHYLLALAVGVLLATYAFGSAALPASLGDALGLLSLALGFVCAWLFAVAENDEVDTPIDAISNADRPLVEGSIAPEEWRMQKHLYLFGAVAFGLLAGWFPFLCILVFTVLYHLYSCPPLRLKRVPVLSSLIVALNALVAVMAGYFLSTRADTLGAFPAFEALGVFLFVLFAENIKNVKDIEGDRAEGIRTLPALLGSVWGPRFAGAGAALSAFVLPVFFGLSNETLLLAGAAAALSYFLVTRKPFKELPVFLLYFVYVALFAFLVSSGPV